MSKFLSPDDATKPRHQFIEKLYGLLRDKKITRSQVNDAIAWWESKRGDRYDPDWYKKTPEYKDFINNYDRILHKSKEDYEQ